MDFKTTRPLSISSISSAASSNSSSSANTDRLAILQSFRNKAATLDGALGQRGDTAHHHDHHQHHHQTESYSSSLMRPRRASAKLQPSPSSASTHSNTSSLFRDDGFEDDLTSEQGTASSSASSSLTAAAAAAVCRRMHRMSFHERRNQSFSYYQNNKNVNINNNSTTSTNTSSGNNNSNGQTNNISMSSHDHLCPVHGEEQDDYQSCEEGFSNSQTTASTTSNLDDCALSTTSSSMIHPELQALDELSLANVKKQYRKSLLLEHQQHLIHSPHPAHHNKIQALLQPPPKLCHLLPNTAPPSPLAGNTQTTSSSNVSAPGSKQSSRIEDRTVNIIGHMPTRSPGYWDSNLSITQRVVTEIIETERTYVDDLEQIVTGYICYLRNVLKQQKYHSRTHQKLSVDDEPESTTNKTMVSAIDIKKLFSNLEDIYKFNKDLLFRLEECYLNPSSVAECFVENALGFDVYTQYCTSYPLVVSTLTELMAQPETAQLLKERQHELGQGLPLGAYLLKPVQRILKYHILFQSLIKHTANDEQVNEKDQQLINEAFSVMTSIACHINVMKKRHEHSIRVQEVQGLLCGWEGPDLTTLGELILEDTFKLFNRQRSSRHLFLFENVLFMTKKKRDGSLCYKGHIECSNLMLIEKIEGHPLVFNTVPFDSPKSLCSFQARNLDKKRDWCMQMKEVIIKSFEVKIPMHVRDILMSLTNSTSPQKISSDSSRAIRAPNYLDRKRKK